MRLVVDADLCEANGVCEMEAPEIFRVEDDDSLTVIKPTPSDDDMLAVEDAVRRCPKGALSLVP